MLADFVGGVLRLHNMPDPWEVNPNVLGQYDMPKLLGMSPKVFWEPTNIHDFWATLKPLEDGLSLIHFLEENFPKDQIYLATSPTLSPFCSSGKHEWVSKHLPKYSRKLFIGAAKEAFAQVPGALLIDDADANTNKFLAAGGRAILWPQPWNTAHPYRHMSNEYFTSCFVSARAHAHLH